MAAETHEKYAALNDKEKMDKRKALVIDIIQSEANFCGELQDFQEYFIDCLLIDTDERIVELLGEPYVLEALQLHGKIVEVTEHLSTSLQTANSGELFAKCFHQFGDENSIALYLRYTEINGCVLETIQSPKYATVLEQFTDEHPLPEGMTVLDALILPTRHYPSYIANFQEFVWLTPSSRPEIPALLEAQAILQAFKQRRASIRILRPTSVELKGSAVKSSTPEIIAGTSSAATDTANDAANYSSNDEKGEGDEDDSSAGASDSGDNNSEEDDEDEQANNESESDSDKEKDEHPQVVNSKAVVEISSQNENETRSTLQTDAAVTSTEPPTIDSLQLQLEIDSLRKELARSEQVIREQSQSKILTERELAKLQRDLNQSDQERKGLLVKIEALNKENAALQRNNDALSAELSDTKASLSSANSDLQAQANAAAVAASSVERPVSSPKSSGKSMGSPLVPRTSLGGGASRRKSMAVCMESHNSLGYFNDEMDENEIIRDNLSGLARSLNIKQEEDKLYLQLIECMTAEFHLSLTLRQDAATNGSWSTFKGELAATCRQLLTKVFSYLLQFINDTHEEPLSELPYPLQWLLKTFPDVGERGSGRSWLPLHWALALEQSPSLREIQLLYEQYGAKTALTQPVSPLSIAVSRSSPNMQVITFLCDECPDLAEHQDADGSYALMHACACNTTTDAVEYLYELYEEAATSPDNFGCYSIHYACFSGYLPVVQYLLHTCPFLASQKSGNGAYPLHDAIQNYEHGGEDLVRVVLNSYSDAVSQPDNDGALPLHHAAKAGNLQVVQLIHKAYPAAAFTADKEGLLPMHYASQRDDKNLNLEVVQYILQTNPKGRVGPLVEAAPTVPSSPSKSTKASGGGFFSKAVSMFAGGANGPGSTSGGGSVRRKSVMQKQPSF